MIAYLKARGQGKTLVSQVVLALDQAFRKYPPATTEKSTILVYSANRTLVEMIDAREGKKRMLENRPCSKKEESVALEDPIESELKKIEHSLPNVDFGVVASVRSILGLNVGVGPFLGLNDGVKLAMASPAGVILDYWCRDLAVGVGSISGFDCWCRVSFGLQLLGSGQFQDWLLVSGRFRALKMEC
ncbi:hypothetical protein JHK87_004388 [Glycine soja]|nr:hypothetical protein JHK87_004388 [Glycine soja]